jgi:hypothetical protein
MDVFAKWKFRRGKQFHPLTGSQEETYAFAQKPSASLA